MPLFNLNTGYLSSVSKTTTYTATPVEDIVYCDATSAAWTLTVPSAASNPKKIFCFKKTDTSFNAITISGTGMTTNYLMTVGETAWFQSDGSNWIQINRITDTGWISFTPTGTWTSNTTYSGRWRRVSDGIEMNVQAVCTGTPTTAPLSINIVNHSAWTIDTSKIVTATSDIFNYGLATIQDGGIAYYHGAVRLNNSTAVTATVALTSGTYLGHINVTQAAPFTFGNGDSVEFTTINIPITNFSA